ncbi:MBL fold metallo-hydrolase [bacterium LRH843]|nr:MBL fold metallo-hydrolase [bacterium LRH843]
MDQQMNYGSDYKIIPATSVMSGATLDVLPDLFCHTIQIVNVIFVGRPDNNNFVLVDAGMPGSADDIIVAAEELFGTGCRPRAILLTHGHFDHVGGIIELINHWKVPVYAHPLELPFLTGEKSYPEPDATVEGGMIAKMSPYFPNEPVNLRANIRELPADGSVPELPGWNWIHTPGHSLGHVSFFREKDRALIAGDVFVTVKQDSLYKVLTQDQEISGPPRYLTPDWDAARKSVQMVEALKPAVAITGHGLPMTGELLADSLQTLAEKFDQIALPDYGKYVDRTKH